MVRATHRTLAVLTMAALAILAACSSSGSSHSSSSSSAAAGTPTSAGGPAKTVTVTLVGPFEGVFASSSQAIKNALTFAFGQSNKGIGPNDAPGFTFKLTTDDSQGQPNLALDDARQAVNSGSHIIVPISTADVLAMKPEATNGQMISFTLNPPAIENDPTQLPWNFNFYPTNDANIAIEMKAAAAKGLKKLALVSDTTSQFQDYVTSVNQHLADDPGAKVVLNQRYDPSTTDFSSVATKIQQSGADSIWFFAAGPPVQAFFQAVQAANIALPIFNGAGSLTCTCQSFSPAFLSKAYIGFPDTNLLGADGKPINADYARVQQQVWAQFGKSFTSGGTYDVDLADAIIYAVKTAGSDDPTKMRSALEAIGASGGIGFTSPAVKYSFSSTNHGGFPSAEVKLGILQPSAAWPGFYQAAPSS
jgi:branched-chain amino acid transport system substrate-binding protein